MSSLRRMNKSSVAIEPPQKTGSGEYKWSEYWQTAVSSIHGHKILIRGYSLKELIENVSYTDILWLILRGELPTSSESETFRAVVCGIIDHYFGNSTTPPARFVASANPESPIPALATGILAMGSNTVSPQATAELIERGVEKIRIKGMSKDEAAKELVAEYQQEGKRIPGIGHPYYPQGDPRAIAIKNVAVANGVWGEKSELYETVQKEFNEIKKVNLPINVDGMMACILCELGFNAFEMAGIGAISFMPGILAHVVEELLYGAPNRVIPSELGAKYVGIQERPLPEEYKRV